MDLSGIFECLPTKGLNLNLRKKKPRQPQKCARNPCVEYVFLAVIVCLAEVSPHISSSSPNLFHLQSPNFFQSILSAIDMGACGRTKQERAIAADAPTKAKRLLDTLSLAKVSSVVLGRITNKIAEGGGNHCSRFEGHGAHFLRPDEFLCLGAQAGCINQPGALPPTCL